MDGIEKITAKIAADAQAEIDALTAQAEKEAAEITAQFQAQAEVLRQELRAAGEKAAAEREERMASVAQLERRKEELAAKQNLLDRAFDRALEKLCTLKDKEYIDLLARLIVEASTTGREEVLFSPTDRAAVGAAAVKKANELLTGNNPPEAKPGKAKADAVAEIGKAVAAAKDAAKDAVKAAKDVAKDAVKAAKGTAKTAKGAAKNAAKDAGKDATQLTLSEETRPIRGGFILREGKVEVNCAFEILVRLQRTEMAGQVAKALFGNES